MSQKFSGLIFIGIIFGIGILMFLGCKKDGEQEQENVSKILVLLKVDYLTHNFEGGQLVELSPFTNLSDTLPLIVNHVAPSDFGSLSVYYNSNNATSMVFNGSLVWMGLGSRSFPTNLANALDFPLLSSPLPSVDSTEFKVIHYDLAPQQIYYDSIWDGIRNLEIVGFVRSTSTKKMSMFLYRPSDGAGDPADWDWYIVMEK
jgi:hypothetical protein